MTETARDVMEERHAGAASSAIELRKTPRIMTAQRENGSCREKERAGSMGSIKKSSVSTRTFWCAV